LLTLLWVVGITNAFNLIDGLDGLAAGVALIAAGTLFVVSLAGGRAEVAAVAAALAGALAGFLYHNFNPASVFLGDSGSLLVGYVLSVLSIQAAQKGATAVVILVPILALGLPIMDTLLAMIRRVLGALHVVQLDSERNEYRFLVVGSASVFRADREHIHHRLLSMGLTHRRAVLLLYGVCVALGLLAFLAVRARGSDTALLVGIVAVASYAGIRKLGYQEVEVLRRGTLLPLFALPVFNRRVFHALVDAGFVAAAHSASLLLATRGGIDAEGKSYLLLTLPVVAAAKLAVLVHAGTYRRVYRSMGADDFFALAKSLVAAQALATVATALTYGLPADAAVSGILDFYFSATLIVGARASFRLLEILARESGAEKARPVLIYGAGSAGLALLREIRQNPRLRYRVAGFVDDSPSLRGRRIQGVPVLGTVADLADGIGRWGVREIILASPSIPEQRLAFLAALCRARGVELRRFRMALEQIETAGARVERIPAPVALEGARWSLQLAEGVGARHSASALGPGQFLHQERTQGKKA